MPTTSKRDDLRPNIGGARPGAGRKPVGHRRLELDQETARLLYRLALAAGLTPEQLIARWTLDALERRRAE